jgi:hypothetical protein
MQYLIKNEEMDQNFFAAERALMVVKHLGEDLFEYLSMASLAHHPVEPSSAHVVTSLAPDSGVRRPGSRLMIHFKI